MAKDGDAPTTAGKGKGKGKAVDEPKDKKPVLNGKKGVAKKEGRLPQSPPNAAVDSLTREQRQRRNSMRKISNSRMSWI